MEHSQVKNVLVIDKDAVKEALGRAKKGLKSAQATLKASEGYHYSTCSMSEDLGWWKGRIALLELLTKMKGLKYGNV